MALQKTQLIGSRRVALILIRGRVAHPSFSLKKVAIRTEGRLLTEIPVYKRETSLLAHEDASPSIDVRGQVYARAFTHRAIRRLGLSRDSTADATINRLLDRLLGPNWGFARFEGLAPLLGVPRQTTLHLSAVDYRGQEYKTAEIEMERGSIAALVDSSSVQPLMVTSLGRSGSTWFQHLLNQHPNIVAHPYHKYETPIARSTLSTSLNALQAWPQTIGVDRLLRSGSLLMDAIADAHVESLLSATAKTIATSYEPMFDDGTVSTSPRYFTEKNMQPEEVFQEMYSGAREIFLVRDFRDVVASSIAANRKWGRSNFGRNRVRSDHEWIRLRSEMARPWILDSWRRRGDSAHLVYYHELVAHPERTLSAVLEYLDIRADSQTIKNMLTMALMALTEFPQSRSLKFPR